MGKIISRVFRTSLGEALDIELFLRPVNLQLDKFLHHVFLRIVTGPTYKYMTQCRKQPPKSLNLDAVPKQVG